MAKLPVHSTDSCSSTGEQGFSLVSVLVIVAVLLTAVLIISQARVNHQTTQKALKLKQSYSDVNQALITDLVGIIHSKLTATAPCINKTLITQNYPFATTSVPSYTYTQVVPIQPQVPAPLTPWPQAHVDAAARCTKPRFPPNGSGNAPADSRIYFCVQLGQDKAAPRDSIMNSGLAFAEVAIELIDLQTQQAISCTEYNSKKTDPKDGSAGMAVTMALYWQGQTGSKTTYSQKALSYIANQN